MERIHHVVIITVIIGIIIGFISPMLTMIAGFSLWILLWVAQGGLMDGNPYKRMGHSGVPRFIEIKHFKRQEQMEIRDRSKYYTTIFVFGIGGILVLIGIIWIALFGF